MWCGAWFETSFGLLVDAVIGWSPFIRCVRPVVEGLLVCMRYIMSRAAIPVGSGRLQMATRVDVIGTRIIGREGSSRDASSREA